MEKVKRERMEKLRREREKTEITLTTSNASDQIRKRLADTNEGEIIKSLQHIAEHNGIEPTKIRGIRKISDHGLKIICTKDKDAEVLRNLDWKKELEGATVVVPLYGV